MWQEKGKLNQLMSYDSLCSTDVPTQGPFQLCCRAHYPFPKKLIPFQVMAHFSREVDRSWRKTRNFSLRDICKAVLSCFPDPLQVDSCSPCHK